jgi:MFS family permease
VTVLLLGVTSFFADVGSEMIFPLLPVFMVGTLGAAPAFLGLVEGLADATASVLKLVMGYLVERIHHRTRPVIFGYALAGAARPIIALATLPWHVLGARVLDRVGKGTRATPRDVLIASAARSGQIGRAFGFHRAMDHAGAVVGPLVATGLLLLGMDLRTVFLCATVPTVLAVSTVLFVREPARTAPSHASSYPGARGHHLSSDLKRYLVVVGLFSLGNSSDAFLLLRARDIGVPVNALPMLWTVLHVSKLVSSYVGGGWADRFPRVRLICVGWSVYALTYAAFGLASQAWHAWALMVVYGTYYGLTEPAEKALVRELSEEHERGRAFGFYNFVSGASAIPAGLLAGWLWQSRGPRIALIVGALLSLLAAAALTNWEARRTRQAGPAS